MPTIAFTANEPAERAAVREVALFLLVFEPTFDPARSTIDRVPALTLTVIVTDAARFSLTPKPTVVVFARCTGFTVAVPVRLSFGAGGVGFGVGVGPTASSCSP